MDHSHLHYFDGEVRLSDFLGEVFDYIEGCRPHDHNVLLTTDGRAKNIHKTRSNDRVKLFIQFSSS